IGLISFSIWLVVVFISKYSSLGSLIAVPLVPVWFYVFHKPPIYIVLGIFIAVYIVLIRHRENIKRLIEGKEPKIGEGIN
ncbi:MAG: glycerol-3-phosphate acyltransferase, partial [Candidatus Melainabacteria bacterium]|nr:glycerol-3-phosphate acyltransferase [Candidatus Melainabacteria bacterium]